MRSRKSYGAGRAGDPRAAHSLRALRVILSQILRQCRRIGEFGEFGDKQNRCRLSQNRCRRICDMSEYM